MRYLKSNLMVGVCAAALMAAMAFANTQADKQVERRGKVIEADKQTERDVKAIKRSSKADKIMERKGRVIEVGDRKDSALTVRDNRQSKKEQPTRVQATKGDGPVISGRYCPDPAARSIDFTILSRTTARSGRVRIEGVVKNIGRDAYVSSPGQQVVQLFEVGVGGGAARLVAQKDFTSLIPELVNTANSRSSLASPSVRVTFERDWDSRSPNLGEFPPTYRLVIHYSSNIPSDGNNKNDDCNLGNNTKERSGAGINQLFRQ